MLLIAACAVLTGARSYAAVGQWAADAPQATLARLDAPHRRRLRAGTAAQGLDRAAPGRL
ncbi:hypothetical protein ACFYW6_37170 [Streptomyces sp. NPDC002659]|uniref:hypothetical protein n=1 Tax=Streptomyces sp. NPDC002659 TaxID=3364656 RepID=UPI0036C48195